MNEARPKVHDADAERIMMQMSDAARLSSRIVDLINRAQDLYRGLLFYHCLSAEQRTRIETGFANAFGALVDARGAAERAHFDRVCEMWQKLEDYFYHEPPKQEE